MRVRVAGEERWIAAEDAGLYRDALGCVPPSGLPGAFLDTVPDALVRLVRRFSRTHGPFPADVLAERLGRPKGELEAVLAELEREGRVVRSNVRITVRLNNGSKMAGVVRNGRFIERHDGLQFVPTDVRMEGAGVRLWGSWSGQA